MARHGCAAVGALIFAVGGCLLYTDPINTPPTIEAIEADAASLHRGQRVTFRAVVRDGEEAADRIRLTWGLRDGEACPQAKDPAAQGTATRTFPVDPDRLGPLCVWVSATDEHGASAFRSRSFEVTNRKPEAHLEVSTAPPGMDGLLELYGQVRLSGAGSRDEDGDDLEMLWRVILPSGEERLPAACPDPPSTDVCFRAESPGRYRVILAVSDGQDVSAPAERTLDFAPDRPPCITATDPPVLPRLVRQADELTSFSVLQVDDDGDPFRRGISTHRPDAFSWSWRSGTSGPFKRVTCTFGCADLDLPAEFFRPSDIVQVRLRYRDRIERDFSACERDDVNGCALGLVRDCFQWVTWTLEYF